MRIPTAAPVSFLLGLLALLLALSPVVTAAEPARGSLRVGVAARAGPHSTLTPLVYWGGFQTKTACYEGLVRFGPQGELEPALLDRWSISADGRVYTLHVRPGVVLHDGRPLDAETVAQHLVRWRGNPANRWLGSTERFDDIEVVSDDTVRVTLRTPWPFLEECAGAINPAFVVGKGAYDNEGTFVRTMGSGPYHLVEQVPNERYLLEAHDAWWQGRPGLARVELVVLPTGHREDLEKLEMLKAGTIDLVADGSSPLHPARGARGPAPRSGAPRLGGTGIGDHAARAQHGVGPARRPRGEKASRGGDRPGRVRRARRAGARRAGHDPLPRRTSGLAATGSHPRARCARGRGARRGSSCCSSASPRRAGRGTSGCSRSRCGTPASTSTSWRPRTARRTTRHWTPATGASRSATPTASPTTRGSPCRRCSTTDRRARRPRAGPRSGGTPRCAPTSVGLRHARRRAPPRGLRRRAASAGRRGSAHPAVRVEPRRREPGRGRRPRHRVERIRPRTRRGDVHHEPRRALPRVATRGPGSRAPARRGGAARRPHEGRGAAAGRGRLECVPGARQPGRRHLDDRLVPGLPADGVPRDRRPGRRRALPRVLVVQREVDPDGDHPRRRVAGRPGARRRGRPHSRRRRSTRAARTGTSTRSCPTGGACWTTG